VREEEKERRQMTPLNLPEGSVRSIIVLILVIGMIAATIIAVAREHSMADALSNSLIQATMTVIGFYFGVRGMSEKGGK
jgi:hypothetical protein